MTKADVVAYASAHALIQHAPAGVRHSLLDAYILCFRHGHRQN